MLYHGERGNPLCKLKEIMSHLGSIMKGDIPL